MANEIQISSITGLTPSIQLYKGVIPVGAPFIATEIAGTGEYIANMPNVPYARYLVVATAGPEKLGSGEILWDGNYEITTALAMLEGLDPNNPMTVTPSQRVSGNISLGLTGDGETSTTVTRL